MIVSHQENQRGHKWVMLQAPGVNAATLGALFMVAIHLATRVIHQEVGEAAWWSIYQQGGLSWGGLRDGKGWQLVTHFFLHGNWTHLLINTALFYYAAARLSHVLSGLRIFALFVVCSLAAALIHVLAQAIFPGLPSDPLVGASGGIFGMLLGFFAISPDSRMLFFGLSARNISKGVLISSSFLFLVTPGLALPLLSDLGSWLSGAFGNSIFMAAHLVHFIGGLIGWIFIGKFFPRLLNAADLAKMRSQAEAKAPIH